MVNKTIAIYSIIDDILKAIQYYEDKRRIMTSILSQFKSVIISEYQDAE